LGDTLRGLALRPFRILGRRLYAATPLGYL